MFCAKFCSRGQVARWVVHVNGFSPVRVSVRSRRASAWQPAFTIIGMCGYLLQPRSRCLPSTFRSHIKKDAFAPARLTAIETRCEGRDAVARIRRSAEPFQEEGEYEYASYHTGPESGVEPDLDSGVLYQPLEGKVSGSTAGSTVPLCEAVANGPCARSVPSDKSKNDESQCNKTGQHCSGKRGGGRRGGGSINPTQICEGAGFGAAVAIVVKVATGPVGAVATVACGVAGAVHLVKEIL
jgi:hypothetical protein